MPAILALAVCEDESQESSEESSANAAGYKGAKVFKIKKTPKVQEIVSDFDLDVWVANETFIDVMIKKEKVESVKALLSEYAIPYTVKISNLHEEIIQQNPSINKMRSLGADKAAWLSSASQHRKENSLPINFEDYNRLSDIYDYLDYLADNYPQFVRVGAMGNTAEKRPIKFIVISSMVENANVVFIDGGIHAREWISPASVIYILSQLVENRESLPEELLYVDFYIVPVLNPDGYEYTHTTDRMWRKNRSGKGECLGTDLNRNFDIFFALTGTSANPCSEIFHGKGPNSELETIALSNLLDMLKGRIKAYISFHSYGQFILIPYAYESNVYPQDFNEMLRVGKGASSAMEKIAGSHYTVGHAADTMYPAAGGSIDWAKVKAGAPYSYCIELRDTGDYGFVLPAEEIALTAEEALAAVKVIAAAAYKAP